METVWELIIQFRDLDSACSMAWWKEQPGGWVLGGGVEGKVWTTHKRMWAVKGKGQERKLERKLFMKNSVIFIV